MDFNKHNQLAVPSANATKPLIGAAFTLETNERAKPPVGDAFIVDCCFAGSSIPIYLSITTLTLPPSVPATGFGQLHSLQQTN